MFTFLATIGFCDVFARFEVALASGLSLLSAMYILAIHHNLIERNEIRSVS
jgi:hypothetical protein